MEGSQCETPQETELTEPPNVWELDPMKRRPGGRLKVHSLRALLHYRLPGQETHKIMGVPIPGEEQWAGGAELIGEYTYFQSRFLRLSYF